jgi:hypothetical protein
VAISENVSLKSGDFVAIFHKSPMYGLYGILFVTKWQKFAKVKNAGTWKVKQFGFYTQHITHL